MALGYRSLVFDISANVAKLTQDFAKVTNAMRGLEKDANQISGSFTKLGGIITGAFKAGAVLAIGYSIKGLIDDVTKAGEEFLKLSKQTGLTVEEVQKLQYAAEQSETDFNDQVGVLAFSLLQSFLAAVSLESGII